jgi:hypothetical protein
MKKIAFFKSVLYVQNMQTHMSFLKGPGLLKGAIKYASLLCAPGWRGCAEVTWKAMRNHMHESPKAKRRTSALKLLVPRSLPSSSWSEEGKLPFSRITLGPLQAKPLFT